MTEQSNREFSKLGCYLLPGHTRTPADAIAEARKAEALGLGKVWLSERFDVKDAGVICAAALTATEHIKVATAGTNLHTRHPHTLATMCSSLHYISGGRFELGLARGVAIRNQLMGLEAVSNAQLVDGLDILRTLWRGGKIMGYDGPMGTLPYLSSGDWLDAEIPIHFIGFGPKSLRFAGQHFDGVHLHTFITPAGIIHIEHFPAILLDPEQPQFLRHFSGQTIFANFTNGIHFHGSTFTGPRGKNILSYNVWGGGFAGNSNAFSLGFKL